MTSKADKPSVVDELADDANPPEYPEGAPLLKPFLQIRPRSRRAEFKRGYAKFEGAQKRMAELQSSAALMGDGEDTTERTAERMRIWAEMDDYYQLMDDLMALAAVNPDAYREWSDEAGDETLAAVFTVYARRSQPGEASSSAS